MNYIALMNLYKELEIPGNKSFSDSELLELLIKNNKKEYYKYFDINAWNESNILLLINQSTSEEDIEFLSKFIKIFSYNIIKRLIEKGYYNFINDNFIEIKFYGQKKLTENKELINYYIDNMEKLNIPFSKFLNFLNQIEEKEQVLNKLIELNRYDLISHLMQINTIWNEEANKYVTNNITDIISILKFFNLEISMELLSNNLKLIDILVDNGYLNFTKKFTRMNEFTKKISEYIVNNNELQEKIIANISNTEEMLGILNISEFQSSKKLLKKALDNKMLESLQLFKKEIWDIDLQKECFKYLDKKEIKKTRNLDELPYMKYISNYSKDYRRYIKEIECFDINNNEAFTNIEKCIYIGKHIEEDSPLGKYYKLISEVKSPLLFDLIMILTDNNINNLNKIIDEFGYTDYFKSYLLFDIDYIKYCFNNNIDIITGASNSYIRYLKILSLDENIHKNLFHLCIDQKSIDTYFNDDGISRKLVEDTLNTKDFIVLLILRKNKIEFPLTETENLILSKLESIESNNAKEIFLNYYLENKEIITNDNIDLVYSLIMNTLNSNSYEIKARYNQIIKKLINKKDCLEKLTELENIFTSKANPEFIKRFAMYKILYGDRLPNEDSNINSPILKEATIEERDKIILNDLLKIYTKNSSKDIIDYFNIITEGDILYNNLCKKTRELTTEEQKLLKAYRMKIEFLVKYTLDLKFDSVIDDLQTIKNIEKEYLNNKYANLLIHYPNFGGFLIRNAFGKAPIILQTEIASAAILKTAYEEGRNLKGENIKIKAGDFIKGVDSNYILNIIENGSLSKEFLGEGIDEDLTHLDTDMSQINENVNSIPELLKINLTGCNFADCNFIIDKEFLDKVCDAIYTNPKEEPKSYKNIPDYQSKTEIICINKENNHYGIRTGFPLTAVKAIIASRNYENIKFCVIKNDFYIPVFDRNGNLILSYEEYYENRKALNGLSYYNKANDYKISNNLITDEILAVKEELTNNNEDADFKKMIIINKLLPIFNKYFKGKEEDISSALTNGIIEIIDTGSTGRNTNVRGDGDFDFVVRLDTNFIKSDKLKDFATDIYNVFNKPIGPTTSIKMNDIHIKEISEPLKVEISVMDKNSKMDYSTEMCIKDRLQTIKNNYPSEYDLVIANIIYAKKLLKEHGVYKPIDGGLGGVGLETFILTHGGSFYDACLSFIDKASRVNNLTEFKKQYHIYDFGKNYYAFDENNSYRARFPYDDYVNKLNENSYKKLLEIFKNYINQYQESKENGIKVL